jgi:hypothetical protein
VRWLGSDSGSSATRSRRMRGAKRVLDQVRTQQALVRRRWQAQEVQRDQLVARLRRVASASALFLPRNASHSPSKFRGTRITRQGAKPQSIRKRRNGVLVAIFSLRILIASLSFLRIGEHLSASSARRSPAWSAFPPFRRPLLGTCLASAGGPPAQLPKQRKKHLEHPFVVE